MTNDPLTNFRSEMPMPDEETTQRTYERATSGRRHHVTRRLLVAVVAVLAAAGLAVGLDATLGGGSHHPALTNPGGPAGGPGSAGKISLNPLTTDFTASGGEYTSIDVSLLSPTSEPTLNLRVVRSDASNVADAETAPSEAVFYEQVSMTDGSNPEDTFTRWSGTLKPSEWTGGCQQALYRIVYDFGTDETWGSSGWFQCSGPDVDAANPFLY